MKKFLVFVTLFAAFSTFVSAQTTTATPKKAKAKSTKTTKAHKATGTMSSSTAAAPVAVKAAPAPTAPTTMGPAATFEKVEMDYGKIKQGSEPLRVFVFKNTGSEPLIISNAQGSCGCTVPTYPKEPIMPGQSSKIEVRYDTQRVGGFTKSVTLTTNEANPTRVLTIKGEVEAKPAEPTTPSTAPNKE